MKYGQTKVTVYCKIGLATGIKGTESLGVNSQLSVVVGLSRDWRPGSDRAQW